MTKLLADLLQAPEPQFRFNLRQLERSGGHQNTDIKLSVEVLQAAKHKLRQLGLDQHDTTGEELYHALQERVSADDRRLERALRTRAATYISAEADLMAGMVHALEQESKDQTSFSIKITAVRRLLKKVPPKHVVKQLKYRSLDSMLRHEQPAVLVAAAQALESTAWRRSWAEAYRTLQPSDFEGRPVKIVCPTGSRWQALTDKLLAEHRYSVLGLPEQGTVILLPLPADKPDGLVIATLALAVNELNRIQTAKNYLQASQVRADFGERLQAVSRGNAFLSSETQPKDLPWEVVHQYFARTKQTFQDDVFGPYVQASEFYWHDVERVLARLAPSLEFWEGTSFLSSLHEGKPVSCNVIDAATNSCNRLSYGLRQMYHAQQALWNELTLRYLNQTNVEAAVAAELQPQLAEELAVN